MSTTVNQKAYLQKYLGGSSGDKKKKKKKTKLNAVKGKGLQIIDDDIDLSKLRPLDGDELDVFDEGEDAPQIAGIIDDRPEELKLLEQLKTSSKWKVVNQDDGFSSKLQVEEIKKDIKETEKDNELIFGKMYSDSEDEKNKDSDASPSRKNSNQNQKSSKHSKKHDSDSDSDFSPPRKKDGKSRKNNAADASPSRPNTSKEKVRKPSRWGEKEEVTEYSNHTSLEDKRIEGRNSSPPSKDSRRRRSASSDASPPRRSKKYDSDASPPRKSRKDYGSRSPPRQSKKSYDSDASPPRKSRIDDKKRNRSKEPLSPSKRRKHSPQRQHFNQRNDRQTYNQKNNRHNYEQRNDRQNNYPPEKSRKHRHSSDSDLSPPRKNKRKSQSPVRTSPENNKRKYNSDSDQSPPRRDKDRNITERDRNKRSNDSPPPTNKKMVKTLDGKMAGLQDARQLKLENDEFRRREEEVYNKMSDDVSGRNAKAVSRKSKRGSSQDKQKKKEKAERQKIIDEKYKRWGKGLKQLEDQEARVQEFMHEASKPLARHKGDRDLEDNLKQIERAGDPMLKYIKEKKRERGDLGPEKPSYKGNFPPNRFNVRPGYRWDGVDRSNGYEKKFFEQQSKKKAQEEEAYKWSTEDL